MLSSISQPVQLIVPDKKKKKRKIVDFPIERRMAYEASRDLLEELHSPNWVPDDLLDFVKSSREVSGNDDSVFQVRISII